MTRIDRRAYAEMYGPTVGDRVRLADTELIIEVERDLTIYGEEVKFGGGKVIRDGMGQSQRIAAEVVDTIITNALIVDHWGIVKADIGLKDGRIVGIGKGGNPDVQPGVDIVALDAALERLGTVDPQQSRVVELRFFAGLSVKETAEALGVSTATVKRDWATAKLWLYHELTTG